jgi:hypothetical protein
MTFIHISWIFSVASMPPKRARKPRKHPAQGSCIPQGKRDEERDAEPSSLTLEDLPQATSLLESMEDSGPGSDAVSDPHCPLSAPERPLSHDPLSALERPLSHVPPATQRPLSHVSLSAPEKPLSHARSGPERPLSHVPLSAPERPLSHVPLSAPERTLSHVRSGPERPLSGPLITPGNQETDLVPVQVRADSCKVRCDILLINEQYSIML